MLRGVLWGAPTPSRADPSRLIQTPPAAVAISGRLLADVRRFPSGCSGLLEVDRVETRGVEGRTELQLPECPAPLLQGWRVQATGVLRRPLPAVHPLLPGSAERLARQGSWSQLRAESIEVLQRPWTPLADLRRDVAQRLQQAMGPTAVLPLLLWPIHQLAGLVITMASWISHWPGAQLLTGRPQVWVVALLVLGLLPWLLGAGPCRRCWSLIPLATALLVHGLMQLGDGVVTVERFDRYWLLARHRGRAALVSHPWRCAQLPDDQEARRCARPRPSGLGAAFGSSGHRRAGLLASAGAPR